MKKVPRTEFSNIRRKCIKFSCAGYPEPGVCTPLITDVANSH